MFWMSEGFFLKWRVFYDRLMQRRGHWWRLGGWFVKLLLILLSIIKVFAHYMLAIYICINSQRNYRTYGLLNFWALIFSNINLSFTGSKKFQCVLLYVDWDLKLEQTMIEIFPLKTADAAYTKINGMLATLDDPFTRIINPRVKFVFMELLFDKPNYFRDFFLNFSIDKPAGISEIHDWQWWKLTRSWTLCQCWPKFWAFG